MPDKARIFGLNFSRIVWQFSKLLFWLFALWMIFWNILRIWPGERFWPVALVNYFTPWFGLLLLPLIIIAVFAKERYLALVLIIAFCLIVVRFVPNFIPSPSIPSHENSIRVMSYNVFQRNADVDAVLGIIDEQNPDIIAWQELTPELSEQLVRKTSDEYPFHTLDMNTDILGQGISSRFPLEEMTGVPDYNLQSVKITTPAGPIWLYNVHTPTLFPTTWNRDWKVQRSFVDNLLGKVNSTEGPVVVMGDFNTTPQSENYSAIIRTLTDSFKESGWGMGFSYPAIPKFGIRLPTPVVRIDYIFINSMLNSNNTQVLNNSGGSDHRPVVTNLQFTQ